jgi:glycosyltransferase involved in cell wall biosynthesis
MPKLRPIPVLLTARELHYGGIQRDVKQIATHLDLARFEPHVASYQVNGIRAEELRMAGVPILHLPVSSLKSPNTLVAAWRMRQYIRKHRIRLVHAWDSSSVFTVPIARILRVPAVLSSMLGSRDLLDQRTHRQMRWTDRMVNAIVVNCESMRRHMIDDEHVPSERIEVCYNGVDTGHFYPGPPAKPPLVADAPFVIGTVCVLRPEKALEVLQEAFARIQHLKPGMKLLIVGSGQQLACLQENAVRLGIVEATVFIPSTHDVATWLRSMDIFVLPSYSEAFSNSLLEAMACGCSVVGSRVGGTPELIGSHDERGLLFTSGDVGDLALKLSKLIADNELRGILGSSAAEFVRKNLTVEIAAERTAAIYEKLLKRKNVRRLQVACGY